MLMVLVADGSDIQIECNLTLVVAMSCKYTKSEQNKVAKK